MKGCEVVLKVVLLVVLVEAATCKSTGSAERVCPPEASNYVSYNYSDRPTSYQVKVSLMEKLAKIVAPCFHELQLPKNVINATTEELQRSFDVLCQARTRFDECLSEKATSLEVCPDSTTLKVFNILGDFLNRRFESVCAGNAARIVRMFSDRSVVPDMEVTRKCEYTFQTIMTDIEKNEVDISSKMFIFHRQIIAFKECMSSAVFSVSMREELEYFIDETISTLQCIHPEDGSLVTCATLDPALVNFTNVCDTLTQHNTLNLYDVLEANAFRVLVIILIHDVDDDGYEPISTDNEKLREAFKEFCDVPLQYYTSDNLLKVKELSRVCSNESDKIEVNLLVDNVKSALVPACTDDGKRLSDIMFEVYHLKKSSPDHSHAVLKCIEDAKLTRKDTDEHRSSSKNLRMYHELLTFKECLINKIRGDQTSVDAATSLINEILGLVKCVNPEDGSTVLCASLMHDHSHAH